MASTGPLDVSPKEFYKALWGRCPDGGFIEIAVQRWQRGKKAGYFQWFKAWPSGLDEFINHGLSVAGKECVYHGIGIRDKMRGKAEDVSVIPCLWAEVDFKNTPKEKALKLLKDFPHKPSCGILSGGGLHLYWFLEEPMTDREKELPRVRVITHAIARVLEGDHQACTLHQHLRFPGTVNMKPERNGAKVEIAAWYPDKLYNPGDFDVIVIADDEKWAARPIASTGADGRPVPQTPGRQISAELVGKLAPKVARYWVEGYRHHMSLFLAGTLAHAGYSCESAVQTVKAVTVIAQDEEADERVRQVIDTYNRFVTGDRVGGAPSMEKLIESSFPPNWRDEGQKMFDLIRRSVSRGQPRGKKNEPDFCIEKHFCWKSDPPRHELHLLLHEGNRQIVVTGEAPEVYTYKTFRLLVFEQHQIYLAFIDQERWEQMIVGAPLERIEAPPEARAPGAIESALEDFIINRKENPEAGDLKAFPGYDESQLFFSLGAFKTFLKNGGLKFTDRQVLDQLRKLGWDRQTKRLGVATAKVWGRPLKTNGHTAPDLFTPPSGNGGNGNSS